MCNQDRAHGQLMFSEDILAASQGSDTEVCNTEKSDVKERFIHAVCCTASTGEHLHKASPPP